MPEKVTVSQDFLVTYRVPQKKGDVFIGPQIQRFTHPVFSPVCIDRLGQGAV